MEVAHLVTLLEARTAEHDRRLRSSERTINEVASNSQRAGKRADGFWSGMLGGAAKFGFAVTGIRAGFDIVKTGIGAVLGPSSDFNSKLSAIKSTSGATVQEMAGLRKTALDLGMANDVGSVSASDAADAIFELGKAGLSADKIMKGAAKAALQMAAAAGPDFGIANSAELAADAINTFKKQNLEAVTVANTFVGAANASSIGLSDLKMGFAAVGAVAATVGLTFQDTATALAVLGQNGIKGSDAGTSLKTMLLNLQPATAAQVELFKQLGIVTANGANQFFDATGKVKDMASISQVLQDALRGMTDQQKLSTLETMFGSDAIRAAAVFMNEGKDGVLAMAEAQLKQGDAARVATEMSDNLKGSWEAFLGTVDTGLIMLGDFLIPIMRDVAMKGNELIGGFLKWISDPVVESNIKKVGDAVGGGLGEAFKFLGGAAKGAWDNVLEPAFKYLTSPEVTSTIKRVAGAIGDTLAKGWDALKTASTWVWDNILKPAFDYLKRPEVASGIQAVGSAIGTGLAVGWKALSDVGTFIWEKALKPFGTWIADPKNKELIGGIGIAIGSTLGGALKIIAPLLPIIVVWFGAWKLAQFALDAAAAGLALLTKLVPGMAAANAEAAKGAGGFPGWAKALGVAAAGTGLILTAKGDNPDRDFRAEVQRDLDEAFKTPFTLSDDIQIIAKRYTMTDASRTALRDILDNPAGLGFDEMKAEWDLFVDLDPRWAKSDPAIKQEYKDFVHQIIDKVGLDRSPIVIPTKAEIALQIKTDAAWRRGVEGSVQERVAALAVKAQFKADVICDPVVTITKTASEIGAAIKGIISGMFGGGGSRPSRAGGETVGGGALELSCNIDVTPVCVIPPASGSNFLTALMDGVKALIGSMPAIDAPVKLNLDVDDGHGAYKGAGLASLPPMDTSGARAALAIVTEAHTSITRLVTAITGSMTTLRTNVTTGISGAMAALVNGIRSGTSLAQNMALSGGIQIGNAMRVAMAVSIFAAIGFQATGVGLAQGVRTGGGVAASAGVGAAGSVRAAVAGGMAAGNFFPSGYNVGLGIASGIASSRPLAIGAAIATANAVKNTINNTLGIHSESKEGVKSGQEVNAGLASGISQNQGVLAATEASINQVIALAKRVVSKGTKELMESFSSITSAVGGAFDLASKLGDSDATMPAKFIVGAFFRRVEWIVVESNRLLVKYKALFTETKGKLAEFAGQVVGAFSSATDILGAMGDKDFHVPLAINIRRFWDAFDTFILEAHARLYQWRGRFDEVNAALAKNIGEAVDGLTSAVSGLSELGQPGLLWPTRFAIQALFLTLDQVVSEFGLYAKSWRARFIGKGDELADYVSSVVGSVTDTVSGLVALGKGDLVWPVRFSIQALFLTLDQVVAEFGVYARAWKGRFDDKTTELSEFVTKTATGIIGALDGLLKLGQPGLLFPTGFPMDALFLTLDQVVDKFEIYAKAWEGRFTGATEVLSAVVGKTASGVLGALDGLVKLGQPNLLFPSGFPIEALFFTLDAVVDKFEIYANAWAKRFDDKSVGLADTVSKIVSNVTGSLAGILKLGDPKTVWPTDFAIQAFFVMLDQVLVTFEIYAKAWKDKATEKTAQLAGWIGDITSNISKALDPILKMKDAQAITRGMIEGAFSNVWFALHQLGEVMKSGELQGDFMARAKSFAADMGMVFTDLQKVLGVVTSTKADGGEGLGKFVTDLKAMWLTVFGPATTEGTLLWYIFGKPSGLFNWMDQNVPVYMAFSAGVWKQAIQGLGETIGAELRQLAAALYNDAYAVGEAIRQAIDDGMNGKEKSPPSGGQQTWGGNWSGRLTPSYAGGGAGGEGQSGGHTTVNKNIIINGLKIEDPDLYNKLADIYQYEGRTER